MESCFLAEVITLTFCSKNWVKMLSEVGPLRAILAVVSFQDENGNILKKISQISFDFSRGIIKDKKTLKKL